jgi:hypothetical protein
VRVFQLHRLLQVPTDAFTLTIRVCRQVHGVGALRHGNQAIHPIFGRRVALAFLAWDWSAWNEYVLRPKLGCLDTDFVFWKVADMALAGSDLPAIPEDGLQLLDLARGFNNQELRHAGLIERP